MRKKLKILQLEFLKEDAELIQKELSKANISFDILLVDNKADFIKALKDFIPDIILADNLPSFNCVKALKLVKKNNVKIPFVLVIPPGSEDVAINLMSEGADDYLIKDRLKRLPKAIPGLLQKYKAEAENTQSFDTSLKASEKHLKSVSADLEKIMDYSLDVICSMDKHGRFIRVSAASARLWGYAPEDLVGQLYINHVDPDYVEITARALSEIIAGNAITNFENRYIHKNGISVPVSWSARWDKEDEIMFCVARDATSLKEAERLEAELEHRWKIIFDRANDAILLANNAGKYTQVNPAAAKILGYTTDELLKLSVTDIVAQKNLSDNGLFLLREFLKKGNQSGIIELKRKDGNIIICHYNAVANILPGLHLSILTDITERENAHRKIDQLNSILEKRAEELAISNKELEQFAYVTSHDLQEPLRMVTSFLQLLQRKYESLLDEAAQKYISYAVDGAARMKTLILDLLEYSRISSYKDDHIIVDLNDVLVRTLHTLKAVIDDSEASITFSDLPKVCGNKSQLMQLFQNLISNALKYKSASKPIIEIGCTDNKDGCKFFVKDNGIGIEPKFFEKIFVIFQRLHNRNEYEGTGIGLSICKRIVELHGGKIWVESSVDAGSKFYFTIAKAQTLNSSLAKIHSPDIEVENP